MAGLVDPTTGRPAFTGPSGEGGYGTPQPGAQQWTMPDGRVAWYFTGQNIQQGNVQALSTYQAAQGQAQTTAAIDQAAAAAGGGTPGVIPGGVTPGGYQTPDVSLAGSPLAGRGLGVIGTPSPYGGLQNQILPDSVIRNGQTIPWSWDFQFQPGDQLKFQPGSGVQGTITYQGGNAPGGLQGGYVVGPGFVSSGGTAGAAGGAGGAAGAGVPGAPSGGTAAQQDAMSIVSDTLNQYGLGSLSSWAWGLITQGAGASQVEMQLRQRPEFQQRFPGIAMREKAGLPPISPGEYVSYENAANQLFKEAGLPPGFYDTSNHLANFIGQDVSMAELTARVKDGYEAAMQAPVEVRQQLQTLYGVDPGRLTAFFLDPNQALPILQKEFRGAQIAGQAEITGYGQISGAQAGTLAALGVTESQARTGFEHLGRESQLFGALPGSQEATIDQGAQLGAEFAGSSIDQLAIEQRAAQRRASFEGGGGFAAGQRGEEGLGIARSA